MDFVYYVRLMLNLNGSRFSRFTIAIMALIGAIAFSAMSEEPDAVSNPCVVSLREEIQLRKAFRKTGVYQGIEYTILDRWGIDPSELAGPNDVVIGVHPGGHTFVAYRGVRFEGEGITLVRAVGRQQQSRAVRVSMLAIIRNAPEEMRATLEKYQETDTEFEKVTCVAVACQYVGAGRNGNMVLKRTYYTHGGLFRALIQTAKQRSGLQIDFIVNRGLSMEQMLKEFDGEVQIMMRSFAKRTLNLRIVRFLSSLVGYSGFE